VQFNHYGMMLDLTTINTRNGKAPSDAHPQTAHRLVSDCHLHCFHNKCAHWLSLATGKAYRLPTEAEWEYAARAGTQKNYWWGGEVNQAQKVRANCDGCGSEWDDKQTAPVGSFDPNPWKLHDTAGNVWEWVEDCWHGDYKEAPKDGSAWLGSNKGD
jgi:formylglycine-generating enzyme required for sulfatase activity